MAQIKNYFFRGLAVLLPTILTIWIFVWGYNFVKDNISRPINQGLVTVSLKIHGIEPLQKPSADAFEDEQAYNNAVREYEEAQEQYEAAVKSWTVFWVEQWGSVAGFIISLAIVIAIGFLLASVVGKGLWHLVEKFILNTPLVRRVYPYVKQVTDFLLTKDEQKKYFSQVVLVEYPRKGLWSIGFVTGAGLRKISEIQKKEFLTVLVPNSPTPVTGYVIIVPKEETILLDMTIEEAFRFIISAGVISPNNKDKFLENKMLPFSDDLSQKPQDKSGVVKEKI